VAHTEISRELLLESPDLGAEDEYSALQHLGDALSDRGAEWCQRCLGVE
jgi:hypothetical protein